MKDLQTINSIDTDIGYQKMGSVYRRLIETRGMTKMKSLKERVLSITEKTSHDELIDIIDSVEDVLGDESLLFTYLTYQPNRKQEEISWNDKLNLIKKDCESDLKTLEES